MRLLLDTQALIWFVEGDKALSRRAKTELENSRNTILISIASLWEITIKASLKKLVLKAELEQVFAMLAENGFELLAIHPRHLLVLNTMQYHHRDPFDRLIISQGISENISIVSADKMFDAYKVKRIW